MVWMQYLELVALGAHVPSNLRMVYLPAVFAGLVAVVAVVAAAVADTVAVAVVVAVVAVVVADSWLTVA